MTTFWYEEVSPRCPPLPLSVSRTADKPPALSGYLSASPLQCPSGVVFVVVKLINSVQRELTFASFSQTQSQPFKSQSAVECGRWRRQPTHQQQQQQQQKQQPLLLLLVTKTIKLNVLHCFSSYSLYSRYSRQGKKPSVPALFLRLSHRSHDSASAPNALKTACPVRSQQQQHTHKHTQTHTPQHIKPASMCPITALLQYLSISYSGQSTSPSRISIKVEYQEWKYLLCKMAHGWYNYSRIHMQQHQLNIYNINEAIILTYIIFIFSITE